MESQESNVSLPVAAEEVRDGDLVLSVSTTGQVRSDAEATLKAELAGTIADVLVKPGDRVVAAQPLVRLDPRPFDLAVKVAEAAVEEAKLRFLEEIVPESLASGNGPTPARRANAFTKAERRRLHQTAMVSRALTAAEVVRAAANRSGAIVLVTVTSLASLVPLAVGNGLTNLFGAIALATAGGTIFATLGAMLVIPALLVGRRE